MIRSDLEQSVTRSSPSEIVSGYLNASSSEMRQLLLIDGQFRKWMIETALIRPEVVGTRAFTCRS